MLAVTDLIGDGQQKATKIAWRIHPLHVDRDVEGLTHLTPIEWSKIASLERQHDLLW